VNLFSDSDPVIVNLFSDSDPVIVRVNLFSDNFFRYSESV
jgi:hypothetical protein